MQRSPYLNKSDQFMSKYPQPIKILFIHKLIFDYRLSFYEELAKIPRYEITVLHSGKPMRREDSKFQEIIVFQKSFFGFLWQSRSRSLACNHDVVVALFDVHYLSTLLLALLPRSFRLIFWGIGFGKSSSANRLRTYLALRADALALYMPGNKNNFIRAGVNENRIFCVRNTIHIEKPFCSTDASQKISFLFIGSLAPRKRIDELVRAFARVVERCSSKITLEIVGDGEMLNDLRLLVSELKLNKRVRFIGKITNEAALAPFFKRAIAMVSPGQAGLSILHSFACGVPVVTNRHAISGGVIENVIDGKNGILYEGSTDELAAVLLRLAVDVEYALTLGRNAFKYYTQSMTLKHSVSEFERAIDFVCSFNQCQDRL